MDEAEYPGIRVSLTALFDGVVTPLKIDISTGDAITPREVRYSFKLMLEDRSIDIWAYNLETVLAEKLETILTRATANTRIRSIYHDMKNHLLVLESSQGTDETRKMAQNLHSQIADYENYIHTGNDFLDIIIRDKAEKAREKQIDFSALVDFKGIDFMKPLDISTIFGNAIDNAMEASEQLPEDQRLITVKAERVRNMLIITVENNTLPGKQLAEGTTKKDCFVHGFGIPNIKKAVEKYDGQCSFRQGDGTYLVKILIPIP